MVDPGTNVNPPTDVVAEHRAQGPRAVRVAVLTVSDTRTPATDASGDRIVALAEAAGHLVARRDLVPDDPEAIRAWVLTCRDRGDVEAAILTGGTGVSPRDGTVEAVAPLLDRAIPGFGELFRMLSFAEIGSAAMMSRATAGLAGRMVVFLLPGSRAGVELAMSRLVVPELPHLVGQARKDGRRWPSQDSIPGGFSPDARAGSTPPKRRASRAFLGALGGLAGAVLLASPLMMDEFRVFFWLLVGLAVGGTLGLIADRRGRRG